jgi:hypothetical protein
MNAKREEGRKLGATSTKCNDREFKSTDPEIMRLCEAHQEDGVHSERAIAAGINHRNVTRSS